MLPVVVVVVFCPDQLQVFCILGKQWMMCALVVELAAGQSPPADRIPTPPAQSLAGGQLTSPPIQPADPPPPHSSWPEADPSPTLGKPLQSLLASNWRFSILELTGALWFALCPYKLLFTLFTQLNTTLSQYSFNFSAKVSIQLRARQLYAVHAFFRAYPRSNMS